MATTKPNNKTATKKTAQSKSDVVETKQTPQRKKITLADVPLNELVEVQSCFYGNLIYVSSKTGYQITWGEFGASQYMPVEEVMTMRNSQPSFFKNQWIRLVGDNAADVINFLQLERYYPEITEFKEFEDIFDYPPQQIREVVSAFKEPMKESFARYAYSMVQKGEIDSMKKVSAIEEATGFSLKE